MHIEDRLSAYCLNELPAAEAQRVEQHLSACEACRREYHQMSHALALMARLDQRDAPGSLWQSIEAKLDGRERVPLGRLALACAAAVVVAALVLAPRPEGPAWEVRRLAGRPEVAGKGIGDGGRIALGQQLVTDSESMARISVGQIGQVEVDPGSRVRLVSTRVSDHRLALEQGKLRAFIWAPPGQFYVDTASAVAVDLGCAYTLEVNTDGRGLLEVTSGWVAFEWQGRESFVPAGARCVTRPRLGPGTPFYPDAAPQFRAGLELLDTGRAGSGDLVRMLEAARERDALTLWHLLRRAQGSDRDDVYLRLAKLVPPPASVTEAAVLRGDKAALDAWWDQLGLGDTSWWRYWKGPIPGADK